MYSRFVSFVKDIYETDDFIALHEPCLHGNEKKYLNDVIDSTFVSSVGKYVGIFEQKICDYLGAQYAVATVNGTAALHIALKVAGVVSGTEVITQALTFVATCNAIKYCGAEPVFVDVDSTSCGMSAESLAIFFEKNVIERDGKAWNKTTNKFISACLPMHTFGHPVDLDAILDICNYYGVPVVEDAAEALGSRYKGFHTATKGKIGILSFNGNKIVTTGAGGVIVTNDEAFALRARHLTTTAKLTHPWEYVHDEVGYNYRMPNLNAALGVAQLERIDLFLEKKRVLASQYEAWADKEGIEFVVEPEHATSNYWLNALKLPDKKSKQMFLEYTNNNGVMTRPAWKPMHELVMYQSCYREELPNTEWLIDRVVNIPSSVIL